MLSLCLVTFLSTYLELRGDHPTERIVTLLKEAASENFLSLSIGGYALLVTMKYLALIVRDLRHCVSSLSFMPAVPEHDNLGTS